MNVGFDRFRVLSRKLLSSYRNGYIGIDTFVATLADGTKKRYERIMKRNRDGDAVVIIPVTAANRFVVTVESRPNTDEGVAWGFPAGMVDEGESFEIAAIRELEEETGYTTKRLFPIENHYQDAGCSGAKIKIFLALDCVRVKEQKLDESERISFDEVTRDELDEIYEDGKMLDANNKLAYLTLCRKESRNEIQYKKAS